jgi:phage repressor protein C with HTH and peptisase S24 domain
MNQKALVEFVKETLQIRSDAALARLLNQSPASFNAKKIRGTIDIIELRNLFESRGIGPQLLDQYLQNPSLHGNEPSVDDTSAYRSIPEYNVRVSAGHGQFLGIEEIKQELRIPRQWLPVNGKVGIVRVEGDSMTPTISNGDSVVVEFDSGYTSDGLYLIRVEDSAYVKRIQREFGSLRIISDNPLYRELTVESNDGNDFGLIGRVALIIRKT